MNFYTQTLLELILALGAAMFIGNIVAIVKRKQDESQARESLKTSPRASRHATQTLSHNQVKEGKATLAVAPLGRSLIFVAIGLFVMIWAGATLVS